jgi:hypothetical protein
LWARLLLVVVGPCDLKLSPRFGFWISYTKANTPRVHCEIHRTLAIVGIISVHVRGEDTFEGLKHASLVRVERLIRLDADPCQRARAPLPQANIHYRTPTALTSTPTTTPFADF